MSLYNLKQGVSSLDDIKDAYGASLPIGAAGGNWYFVNPANGNDSNSGESPDAALASVATAEDKCTANNNDVVAYIGDSSGFNLTAALTWDKSYTHLIGICSPVRVAKRARIFQLSTLTGASPLLNITASGCIFKDFYIFQGVDDATSLINVQVTGERNFFENVHFAGGGHATQAVDAGSSLNLEGGSENLFSRCVFGVDTIDAATGMMAVTVDGEATRNIFEDCYFTMKAGNAGAGFVELMDNSAIDRYMIFKNCLFINSSATAMNSAFVVPAGMSVPRGPIILHDCLAYGADDWEDQDRGVVMTTMGTFTAGGNAGLAATVVVA